MSVHIFNGPLYRTCEVYIDDLLFHGQNDEDFVINTRQIFQICREKGVILSAKKLVIGMISVPFVGHEVDSVGHYTGKNRKHGDIHKARITQGAIIISGGCKLF